MAVLWICLALIVCAAAQKTEHVSIGEIDLSELPPDANPEEFAGKFEGDIDMTEEELRSTLRNRNAMRSNRKWPGGVVYYQIISSYSSGSKSAILRGMRELEKRTAVNGKPCITFRERRSESAYLNIQPKSGCYSSVGRTGRDQTLSIGRGCESIGTVMHELLHALGFYHEQGRADRDSYVTIDYSNIPSNRQSNFRKLSLSSIQHLTDYDYGSVMHYGKYAFAINRRKPTIIPKKSGVTIGQRTHLSANDIKEVQLLYGCTTGGGGGGGKPTSKPNPGTQKPVVTRKPPTSNGKFDCTFDSGNMCGWTQDTYDNMDWTLRKGKTPSTSTGPVSGYGNGGYYVYVEASGNYRKRARLLSPYVTGTSSAYCLRFAYHMYGNAMGSLYVGVKKQGSYKAVFSKSGSQSNSWRTLRLQLTYTSRGTPFQFYFEGYTGGSYNSDIAIDNVSLRPGKC